MGYLEVKTLLADAVARRIGSGMAASFGNLKHHQNPGKNYDIFVGTTSHQSRELETFGVKESAANHLNFQSIHEDTYFDLASLTKILATTTLAMKRFDQGRLDLDDSLQTLLPEACAITPALQSITVRHLLSHASGLPAWKPFYETLHGLWGENLAYVDLKTRKEKFDALLYAVAPVTPPLQKVVYSDLGFLLLEDLLSTNFKDEVETLWRSFGIPGLHFRPVMTDALTAEIFSQQKNESMVATENCPWRGLLVGQVHDDNSWSRGGISGHAGVFGRLSDVRAWLEAIFLGAFISRSTLKKFTSEAVSISGVKRALGFDMPSADGSGSTGFWFSKDSVGHLGFTGTSLWLDLQTGDYAILLTNRVHPSRDDTRIRTLRREFHRRVREH